MSDPAKELIVHGSSSLAYSMLGNDICGFDSLLFSKEKRETSQQKGGFLESDQLLLTGSHLTLLLEQDLAGQRNTWATQQ